MFHKVFDSCNWNHTTGNGSEQSVLAGIWCKYSKRQTYLSSWNDIDHVNIFTITNALRRT